MHSQINRSLKGQATAFKDSPFDSSNRWQRIRRFAVTTSFGRATFHLQEEKTSLTHVVSSSMLLRRAFENMQAKRKTLYVCNGPYHLGPLRHIGLKRVVKRTVAKVRLIQKILTARLLYYV